MSAHEPVIVRVVRSFEAPPDRVFDAWLDPKMIARFMFGPHLRDETIVRLEIDARVGGSFSFVVRRGGEEFDHVGEYVEIERPARFVFTWGVRRAGPPDMSRVIIEIAPRPSGSELTLIHELHPDWADYAERTQAGWTKMLEALATSLATPR